MTNGDPATRRQSSRSAEAGARPDFLKVMEPLRDAEQRKMGFLEAAEVYSGPMGVMN